MCWEYDTGERFGVQILAFPRVACLGDGMAGRMVGYHSEHST